MTYHARKQCRIAGNDSQYYEEGWRLFQLACQCITAKAADLTWEKLGKHMRECQKAKAFGKASEQ